MSQEPAIDVLWTGGWDSSFRVVSLMLETEAVVRPHYLVDEDRESTGLEILAMRKMRRALIDSGIDGGRLLPTVYFNKDDVPPITAGLYEGLTKKHHLGSQYRWLIGYAETREIASLDLSVNLHGRIWGILQKDLERHDTVAGPTWRVVQNPSDPSFEVFRRFAFPLMGIEKEASVHIAMEAGYTDVLKYFWFCHSPRKGRPCGLCGACSYAIIDGMQSLIPFRRLMRYRMTRLRRRFARKR